MSSERETAAPEPKLGRVHICGKAGREAPGEECDMCALFVEYVADCDRKRRKP